MPRSLIALAAVLACLALASPSSGQQYIALENGTWCQDVTPDGNVVVGNGPGGAFYWRWREDPAPVYIGGIDARAVTDDGSIILGNIPDPLTGNEVAARWTAANGWTSLGGLDTCGTTTTGYDMSGDGSMVVGLAWDNCDAVGFLWKQGVGLVALESLGLGHNRCSAISGDGSILGGFAQGNFNRTPAIWFPDTTGSVYDMNWVGEIYGFNEDGSLILGTVEGDAFVQQNGGGATIIGQLTPGWEGLPHDVTQDGKTVVGFDVNMLARTAWVWTTTDGLKSLDQRLDDMGIAHPPTQVCLAVSEDGKVMVGGGGAGFLDSHGFIVDLSEGPWSDLGGGTPGLNGVPTLEGTGSMLAGSQVGVDLNGAHPNAPCILWVTTSSSPLTIFGGTLHAFPPEGEVWLATDASGSFFATTAWPAGIPAGTEVVFQFLIGDQFAFPWGINMSNGLLGTQP